MAYIYYNSKLIRPVQTVNIVQNFQKDGTGQIIGELYNITVELTLMSYKGSPRSDGTFWTVDNDPPDENIASNSKLASLIAKRGAIEDLFAQQGLVFEIQPLDASQSLRCNPRVNSIVFREGTWIDTLHCTIELEADELYPLSGNTYTDYISAASESWSIETDETPQGTDRPRIYRLTHNVSAVGKRFFDSGGTLSKEPWQQARSWVLPKLGFDNTIALSSGVNNLPTYYGGYNHIRSENINESDGSFAVVESWILASGSYLEDFTVSTQRAQDGFKRATIDGTITGLEERDSDLNLTTSKWTNALTRYNTVESLVHGRAENYSGFTLNSTPITRSTGRNPNTGVINYTFEYDDRSDYFVSGVVSEAITLNKSFEADLFASIPVLGRSYGPVLQDLSSYQQLEVGLNMELVFDSDYFPSGLTANQKMNAYSPLVREPYKTQIEDIIDAANPVGNTLNNAGVLCTTSYKQSQNYNWSINERRFSYSVVFVGE